MSTNKKTSKKQGDKKKKVKKASSSTKQTNGTQETKLQVDEENIEQDVAGKAVAWAIKIAADDAFHYGDARWANHDGCFFCKTNNGEKSEKISSGANAKMAEKSYSSGAFVAAAFYHGGNVSNMRCSTESICSNLFKSVKKPEQVTSLEPGDILVTHTHYMIYVGGEMIVHASHHDDGEIDEFWASSICREKLQNRQWNRIVKIYRFAGSEG